jgi:hypothetical protein
MISLWPLKQPKRAMTCLEFEKKFPCTKKYLVFKTKQNKTLFVPLSRNHNVQKKPKMISLWPLKQPKSTITCLESEKKFRVPRNICVSKQNKKLFVPQS